MGEVAITTVLSSMEVEDMMLDTQEVTVMSESDSLLESLPKLDPESTAVGDLLDEIVAKVTTSVQIPIKKLKENDDVEMEGNILSLENKENIKQGIKRMSRKELEGMVLITIVEALVKQSEVGKFRTKLLEMTIQKEKMQQRVTHLQKQVVEMGKAVKLLLDNHNRDPNNLNPNNKKRPPPIKFYRSVGLQVTIEPSVRNGTSKVIHVNNIAGIPLNGVAKPLNGTIHNIPTKRPGPKSLTEPKATKHSPETPPQTVVAKGLTQMNGHLSLSPTKVPIVSKMVTSPTVVDLTDDVVVSSSGDTPSGVFRLVNTGPGGYQVLTNGQNRSILLAQNVSAGGGGTVGRPVSAVVVRNVSPATTPRPMIQIQPRAPIGSALNRPATVVTIPNRPVNAAAVVRQPAPQPQQQNTVSRKIQLPPLPASAVVPVPKGRILKELPPKPVLTLNEQADGIVLSWTMKLSLQNSEIASYQIYACQESLAVSPGKTSSWKKVGDVKALPLPMACTLSQFTQGNRYFFIVRANDTHGRSGPFCEPSPIILQKK